MRVAYVDTSFLVAMAFGETGADELATRLTSYDECVSANLTEAEFRAALRREEVDGGDAYLARLAWLLPDRPLSAEIAQVLRVRYLKGADLWHLACALFLADDPRQIDFLSLDENQRSAARELRFNLPI